MSKPLTPSDIKPCARCGRPRRNKGGLSRLCRDCQGMGWPVAHIDWKDQAACREEAGHNPDLWWPADLLAPSIPVAVGICQRCPVKAQCLAYAIEHRERYGIWGGLLPTQRFQLAKANKRGK